MSSTVSLLMSPRTEAVTWVWSRLAASVPRSSSTLKLATISPGQRNMVTAAQLPLPPTSSTYLTDLDTVHCNVDWDKALNWQADAKVIMDRRL